MKLTISVSDLIFSQLNSFNFVNKLHRYVNTLIILYISLKIPTTYLHSWLAHNSYTYVRVLAGIAIAKRKKIYALGESHQVPTSFNFKTFFENDFLVNYYRYLSYFHHVLKNFIHRVSQSFFLFSNVCDDDDTLSYNLSLETLKSTETLIFKFLSIPQFEKR